MQRFDRLVFTLVFVLSVGAPSWAAAQAGSVSGIVFDGGGQAVASATVRITGDRMPAGRSVETQADGSYNFQLLLPGRYTVTVEKPDVGRALRPVIVEVDKDTQVDMVLGVEFTEALTVSAAAPIVDMTSSEVNFNYRAETIAALPLQRTYAGLFQLIPGVADNNSTVGPNAGGSRQDNTYLLDGVNITNPGFGTLNTEVNEFDILEFNVKRAGITAEFGRSSGFVANAVTRSGTNELAGGVRFEAIPAAWVAESRSTEITNTSDRWVTSFGLGGPLVQNHVFWYASGQVVRETTFDRVNNFGPLPDREDRAHELFGKVTATPSAKHFLNLSYRHRPNDVQFGNIGVNDSPALGTHSEGRDRVAVANWNWFPDARTTLEVRYLRLDDRSESVAVTELGVRPPFDVNNLAPMGNFFDPVANASVGGASLRVSGQNYDRSEMKATLSRFLNVARTTHHVKAGLTWETTTEEYKRLSNGWGSISLVQNNTQVQARYYPDQAPQLSKSRTWGLFVQDDITLTPRLVINAGLLVTRDEFAQELEQKNTFLTFGFGQEIQPRVGINYNLREQRGDKIYANYGRYINLDQKSSARTLAPNNLYQSDALFDRATGALISDLPLSNSTGKVLDPDLEPVYFDEYMVGYATPLRNWSLDAFFMFRDGANFIEDSVQTLPASDFVYTNLPGAERRYRALTLELNRPLANGWSLNVSYAISKMYGNFELDGIGSSGTSNDGVQFNTSSFLQDGPGIFVEDTFRQGPLNQDRTHVLKLLGTYMLGEHLSFGTNIRFQSGQPWAAMGRDWWGGYRRFLEPAGSRRNDAWTNVDLLTAYRLPLMGKFNIFLEARALNVFNTQTAIFRDVRQYLDGRIRSFTSPPPEGCFACYTDLLVQGTTQPNPRFGEPTEYAKPRRLLLSVKTTF
jgi:hypothetical protein